MGEEEACGCGLPLWIERFGSRVCSPTPPPEGGMDGLRSVLTGTKEEEEVCVVGQIEWRRKHGGYGCPSFARLHVTDSVEALDVQLVFMREHFSARESNPRFDAAIALTRVGSVVRATGRVTQERPKLLSLYVRHWTLERADGEPMTVKRVVDLFRSDVLTRAEALQALRLGDNTPRFDALVKLATDVAREEMELQEQIIHVPASENRGRGAPRPKKQAPSAAQAFKKETSSIATSLRNERDRDQS